MKNMRSLFWVLTLFFGVGAGFSQTVVKIMRPYILIDNTTISSLKVGDNAIVVRSLEDGGEKKVATAKVMVFREGKFAARIVSKEKREKIRIGDLVRMDDLAAVSRGNVSERGQTAPLTGGGKNRQQNPATYSFSKGGNPLPAYLSFSAGVISCGLGSYFYYQAGRLSKDPVPLVDYANVVGDVRQYDKQANFCFGLGIGLITYGIAHYLWVKIADSKADQRVSLYNPQKDDYVGIGFQLSLDRGK
jgi:hypothetical protein